MTNGISVTLRRGWMVLILLVVGIAGAAGQGGPAKRAFVQGEIIISVAAGTPGPTVTAIANTVNATVVQALGVTDAARTRETWWLRMIAPKMDDASTLAAVNTLQANPQVLWAGTNAYRQWHQTTPNDPMYKQQWHLPLLNLPLAWDIEKGQPGTIVCVVDSGVDVNHPDLKDRLLPSQNFSGVGAANDLTDNVPHGCHVTGILGATTNNGIGVSGVTWGCGILSIKGGDVQGIPISGELQSFDFAAQKGARVINCSFGSDVNTDVPDLSVPDVAKIDQLAKKGIIFCISAGNHFQSGNPASSPANLAAINPNVYCIASVGPRKEHAVYSQARSYTTFASPGGNQTGGNIADQILSTVPVTPTGGQPSSYGYEEGTSMASPAAAGVVGLLCSVSTDPAAIRDALIATTNPHFASPDTQFGYGVIDAYQALLRLAVGVTVTSPAGTGGKATVSPTGAPPAPVETMLAPIRIQVRQIIPANLTITLDGEVIPYDATGKAGWHVENILSTTTDANGNTVPDKYDAVIYYNPDNGADPTQEFKVLAPGKHTITVSGSTTTVPTRTATDTRTFNITPHIVPQGRSMISIPYYQGGVIPESYLGTEFRLARWLPDQQRYVFYTSFGPKDTGASFSPTDTAPHQDGDPTPRFPLGLAFWADVESLKPILTRGQALTDKPFVIPIKGNGTGNTATVSWNMVGDPFPFDVPFNALIVDTHTADGRISLTDAVNRGYLLPNIYTFDGNNGYTFQTIPVGSLIAWSGHWVGVTSKGDIDLVVPPLSASRAAKIASGPSVVNGWAVRLRADAKNLHDTYNFIGASTRAAEGYDRQDVLKPPMVSPFVTLGILHDDWGSRNGLYAQDIRAATGTRTWPVVVNTDQANTDVTISWDNVRAVPRDVRLTLKDEATGQTVDMRTRSSITFNSGTTPATRKFTITQAPMSSGIIRISNVTVTGRGAGTSNIGFTLTGDATYDVKVMSVSGQSLGTIATRAAAAGDVHVLWNGKDASGKSVPAGTYIVQIRAIGPDGNSVRVIQPFAMLR